MVQRKKKEKNRQASRLGNKRRADKKEEQKAIHKNRSNKRKTLLRADVYLLKCKRPTLG